MLLHILLFFLCRTALSIRYSQFSGLADTVLSRLDNITSTVQNALSSSSNILTALAHRFPVFGGSSAFDDEDETSYSTYKTAFIIGSIGVLIVLGIILLISIGVYCFSKSSEEEDLERQQLERGHSGGLDEEDELEKRKELQRIHRRDLDAIRRKIQKEKQDNEKQNNQSAQSTKVEYDVDDNDLYRIIELSGDLVIDPTTMPMKAQITRLNVPAKGSQANVTVLSGLNPDEEWAEMEFAAPKWDPTAALRSAHTETTLSGERVQVDNTIDDFDLLQLLKHKQLQDQKDYTLEEENDDDEDEYEKKNNKKKNRKGKGKGRRKH